MSDVATPRRTYVLASAIIAIAVAAAVGLVAGYQIGKDPAEAGPAGQVVPADDSVDAGFARDMQVHHAQAVEMSYIVRDNTGDKDVRLLAYDIATTQQGQIGYMTAWLDMWGLPHHSSAPAMAWMSDDDMSGHDMSHMPDDQMLGDDGLMPGMATPEQMDKLRQARGKPAEILYLQLMIRHHMGGIEMARYAVEHAKVDDVRHLAETMVTSQTYEIDAMNDMLVERGAKPIT